MLELSSNSNFEGFPLVPKNSTALRKIDYVLFNGEKTKDLNLLEVSLNQSFIPDERETMVVLLKHLAHVSVTGVNLIKEHDFESNSLPDINMDDFEFSIDKGRVLYSYQNQKYSRHSPYVCKLLKLIRNIT